MAANLAITEILIILIVLSLMVGGLFALRAFFRR